MIHRTDGGAYVISSHHVWRPGAFESERAARYAYRFPDEVLRRLQEEVNRRESDFSKRVITFADLQRARRTAP